MISAASLLTLALLIAPAGDAPEPDSGTGRDAPSGTGPGSDSTPGQPATPATEPTQIPKSGIYEDYIPPFPTEEMTLSDALQESVDNNIDLALGSVDVQISEAQVLAALGAYDVFLSAGISGSLSETPQRGSAFTFNLSTRTLGGNVGFQRKLETGGTIQLSIGADRTLNDQAVNPFDASQGSTTLSNYRILPSLTLTHPLLKGAGLKINRADINKAKIATTQAEAARLVTAQNLANQIIAAYWDVLFAHRDLINKRRSVELSKKQLERTRALVSAGRLSPVDAKAVEQGLASRESEVLTAENALLDTSLTLRTSMGQEFADRELLGVFPTTDPVVRPRPVDIHAEVDRALQTNPQIRQTELSMASLRIDEMVAANNRLPQLDFSGTFTPQGRSVDSSPDAGTGDPGAQGNWGEAFRNIFNEDIGQAGLLADWTVSGSLTLTWDVQNRGPKGNHEAVRLQLKRTELQIKQVRQTIAANVIRAANSLRTAAKVMEVSEISLELALENLEAEEARFEVGRSTNFDVLQRLDEVDAAAAQALSAQIGYLKALVQLQSLNGEILPAYGLEP